MADYIKCDRCGIEYHDEPSVQLAVNGVEDWKRMCEKYPGPDGSTAVRGLVGCTILRCPGEFQLVKGDA